MLKVMTIVGTRPEIIKLSRVIDRLDRFTEHVLVHTDQNYDYELNHIFFQEMRLKKPKYSLKVAGKTPMETIANVLVKSDKVLQKEKPDAVLIYGDTNSCLAALSAKRRKIPVFHMEAGNRCFDQRVPEEINRRLVDHLSDINLTISEYARRYLLHEGIPGETVLKVGSCMKEVLEYYRKDIDSSDALQRLKLREKDYFVVSIHREENLDSDRHFLDLMNSLNALAKVYRKRILVSTHPRTRKKVQQLEPSFFQPEIEWSKPFGFFDYVSLQTHALCVLSDSGTLPEEAALLGFPAVALRQAQERPEGMEEGVTILSGLKADRVLPSVKAAVEIAAENHFKKDVVSDYEVSDVSDKVVKIILSYTDYVRRTVWREGDL